VDVASRVIARAPIIAVVATLPRAPISQTPVVTRPTPRAATRQRSLARRPFRPRWRRTSDGESAMSMLCAAPNDHRQFAVESLRKIVVADSCTL